jgi:hypothetical protein
VTGPICQLDTSRLAGVHLLEPEVTTDDAFIARLVSGTASSHPMSTSIDRCAGAQFACRPQSVRLSSASAKASQRTQDLRDAVRCVLPAARGVRTRLKKRICVFAGSNAGTDSIASVAAVDLAAASCTKSNSFMAAGRGRWAFSPMRAA